MATPEPTPTAEATPTPPPAPAKGRLNISVTPWGYVSIDGKEVDVSPVSVALDAGRHKVTITHPDYYEYPQWVTVAAGETGKLSVDLPTKGRRR